MDKYTFLEFVPAAFDREFRNYPYKSLIWRNENQNNNRIREFTKTGVVIGLSNLEKMMHFCIEKELITQRYIYPPSDDDC